MNMLPRLSQRTDDLMRRAIDAVDTDTAVLSTTMVASAFVDGRNACASEAQQKGENRKKEFA